MMTSVNFRNPDEEEKLELMDEFYDYNINYKINICTKSFFDKIINNVLLKAKERTSLLRKAHGNRFSVSNNNTSNTKAKEKDYIALTDFTNKCNKESRKFLSEMIKSTINKFKNEKKVNIGHKDFLFNNFEFHKSNKDNLTVNISRKFLDISIKNCLIKLKNSQSFHENRRSLEVKFLERKSKLGSDLRKNQKEISEFYNKNIDMNDNKCFKNASEFFSKAVNNILSQLNQRLISITNNPISSNQLKVEDESDLVIENIENENSKFTKSFFAEKVRNTVTQIFLEKESIESNSISFTKSFLNDKIRKTISSIDTEALKDNILEIKNVTFSHNNESINEVIKPSANVMPTFEIKRPSIKTPDKTPNKEPFKRLSSKLDERIEKKFGEEAARKSKKAEFKLIQEKQEIEKEIELSNIKNASISFWGKSLQNTMVKYNEYHEKFLKSVIKIQSNFRMNLWRFIIKIELMNVRLQRENERAMAASRRRRSTILMKPAK